MKIATCKNRTQKTYLNREVTWEQILAKLEHTTRTKETLEEYKKKTKDQQADIKDVGGFVAGELSVERQIKSVEN